MTDAPWGCLSILNKERMEARSREPLTSCVPEGSKLQDDYVRMLESQVAWIAHLINFMDVKLKDDLDYEILRSLLGVISLDRGCRDVHTGQVFALVHGNRWAETIDKDEALEEARNRTLHRKGPTTGTPSTPEGAS